MQSVRMSEVTFLWAVSRGRSLLTVAVPFSLYRFLAFDPFSQESFWGSAAVVLTAVKFGRSGTFWYIFSVASSLWEEKYVTAADDSRYQFILPRNVWRFALALNAKEKLQRAVKFLLRMEFSCC